MFGYMQFLMNKISKELIDLFTKCKCITFCINLLIQSCFRNSTWVIGSKMKGVYEFPSLTFEFCTGTPLFPCFDVFIDTLRGT